MVLLFTQPPAFQTPAVIIIIIKLFEASLHHSTVWMMVHFWSVPDIRTGVWERVTVFATFPSILLCVSHTQTKLLTAVVISLNHTLVNSTGSLGAITYNPGEFPIHHVQNKRCPSQNTFRQSITLGDMRLINAYNVMQCQRTRLHV